MNISQIPLFDPAHDLALAKGVRHFTPPVAARRLATDLAALAPLWQPDEAAEAPLPWGWNYNTCKALASTGVAPERLPSQGELETLRRLSSRTVVIDLLQRLRASGLPDVVTGSAVLPRAVDSAEALTELVEAQQGHFLLKAPWSSSGRGLSWSRVMPKEALLRRGAAIIREMGCVLWEPELEKVQDFAMLFYADRREVHRVGYSMFETDAMGTYRHGLVADNAEMARRLGQWVAPAALAALGQAYAERLLPDLLAPLEGRQWPLGYVGVDMMVYRTAEGELRVQPCVEVNLRCTMGVVARRIYDRLAAPGAVGTYEIDHAADAATLRERRERLLESCPPTLEGGRYRRGYFPLTAVTSESQFAAAVRLE
jgi:hypothetical protein